MENVKILVTINLSSLKQNTKSIPKKINKNTSRNMFILMILTIFIVLYITGYHFSNFLNHIYLFVLQLIISMMFCVVDWCMHMPINSLLETTDSDKGCIYKVFQVLTIIFLAFTFIHHSLCHFCI